MLSISDNVLYQTLLTCPQAGILAHTSSTDTFGMSDTFVSQSFIWHIHNGRGRHANYSLQLWQYLTIFWTRRPYSGAIVPKTGPTLRTGPLTTIQTRRPVRYAIRVSHACTTDALLIAPDTSFRHWLSKLHILFIVFILLKIETAVSVVSPWRNSCKKLKRPCISLGFISVF